MGKTFRRDQQYRPRKHGRTFTKDQVWKKHKHSKQWEQSSDKPPLLPDDITQENFNS